MQLDELRAKAVDLFPQAANFAISKPGELNAAFDELQQLCSRNHVALGFDCEADCFGEIVPKHARRLTLDAWCRTDLEVSGWKLDVTMRPFYLGARYVHFEIRHDGPLPGLTEAGYRSRFAPLVTFAEVTPEEFLSGLIPRRPRVHQLTLF